MELSDIIRSNRIKMGMNIEELANKLGVSKATVSRWESGNIKDIKRDKIEKLSYALDIDVSILMGWDKKTSAKAEAVEISEIMKIISNLSDEELKKVREFVEYVQSKKDKQ